MTDRLRIALAQLNPVVGALDANLDRARRALAEAEAAGADIVLFPELFLTGYIPEDLLLHRSFVADAIVAAKTLAAETRGLGVSLLLPTIWEEGGRLRNAVILAEDGAVREVRLKVELPVDDVFYEPRYFEPGPLPEPLTVKGVTLGVPICEDIWHRPVCDALAAAGAQLLLCPNGSPYTAGKDEARRELARARILETGLPLIYLNQVGGQDELVYDGASFALDGRGEPAFAARAFAEDFIVSDWERRDGGWACVAGSSEGVPTEDEALWRACVLSLGDYVRKNGFSSVLFGLSGGLDSAVVAAMAVDALGADAVHALMLPYRYTSPASLADARECATRLGIRYDVVPIAAPVEGVEAGLAELFAGRAPDLAEENIQSRMRGLVLMAVSNKFGGLLLTTGNKSEIAVGYATIYGDMNGGFNPIKDLFKTEVYRLAAWRNANRPADALGPAGEVIPAAILTKPPSAELRPDQTDQDSLPPYPVLDAVLRALVEEERSVAQTVALGFERDLVVRIDRLVRLAEYKRRQAAPGPKLSRRAFGQGRRYPITNGYKDTGRP